MGFLPSVNSNVFLQIAGLGECLKAFLALMRFLPSMNPNVIPQIAGLGE